MWSDFNKVNEEALHKAELLSGLPTLVLLFVAFGAMIAAGLPLLLALAGIAVGLRGAAHALVDHADVGVVDELLDDDRPRGRHRLQPLHRQPLPRGTRRRQGRRSPRSRTRCRPPARRCSSRRSTVVLSLAAVFLVPVMVFRSMALGMILSVVAVALAALTLLPAVLVALGDKVLVTGGKKDPDIVAESRWARWTGVALRRPGAVLAIGLVVLGVLVAAGARHAPRHARRAGRRPGPHQPRRLRPVVKAFGPGAAAPAFVTVPAADANTRREGRRGRPQRRRRPRRHRAGRDRARRRAGHPEDRRSTTPRPPR